MYPCASSAFPNAEDAYAGVAYLEAIFLPALPVPYFPRSVSCSPVPISLHAKIGRVILRGVPACVMPRRSFSKTTMGDIGGGTPTKLHLKTRFLHLIISTITTSKILALRYVIQDIFIFNIFELYKNSSRNEPVVSVQSRGLSV